MSTWLSRAVGRRGVCGGRRAVLGGAVLAVLVGASVVRVPAGEWSEHVRCARVQPARLAHLLADFTSHPHGGGAGAAGGWRLEEEHGNYTWWWYRVTFECGAPGGARCAGEARVLAGSLPPRPDTHLVTHRVTLCTSFLPLPWLASCDELEVESVVSPWAGAGAEGGGSMVEERTRARCSVARVLGGACWRLHDAHRAARRAALAARGATLHVA